MKITSDKVPASLNTWQPHKNKASKQASKTLQKEKERKKTPQNYCMALKSSQKRASPSIAFLPVRASHSVGIVQINGKAKEVQTHQIRFPFLDKLERI
jgi:uncharacterized HAD superfamily protein